MDPKTVSEGLRGRSSHHKTITTCTLVMSTLRHTEDFSWNFGEDHGEEAEVLVNDPDEAYNQLMSDGAEIGPFKASFKSETCSIGKIRYLTL